MKQKTIFISLVAYCDNELVPTLIDIFKKARYPERVHVGLINQDDDPPQLHEVPELLPWLNQIGRMNILPSLSKGYGACRAEVNERFYKGEDFYFQIAPHSRLAQDWDVRLLNLYKKEPGKRHILVSTPHDYNPETETKSFFYYVCGIKQFHSHAIVEYATERKIDGLPFNSDGLIEQSMFVAACIFAPARWLRDVPFDDNIYLMGEEFDISIRTFGAGYRALMFKEPIVWHCWGRRNRKRIGQIDDKANFDKHNNEGKKYIFQKLLADKYDRQSEFMALHNLTRKDLEKVYRDFMREIGGYVMAEKYIRARALLSHRYSTGFKTHAGDVLLVPEFYLVKFPAHFEAIEDNKPGQFAPAEVKNMKAEETAPISTESEEAPAPMPAPTPEPEKAAKCEPIAAVRDMEEPPQPAKRKRGRPKKGAKC